MRDLILVNVLIIILDITLVTAECLHHYEIQTTYKSLVYSIKLKLEFAILNQLVYVCRSEDSNESMISEPSSVIARARQCRDNNAPDKNVAAESVTSYEAVRRIDNV